MKQISQDLNTGNIKVLDTPAPKLKKGNLIIKSTISLISSGTERMLLDFGKSNIINKIKSQPEKAQQVIEKIKTDGLIPTFQAVNNIEIPFIFLNRRKGDIAKVIADNSLAIKELNWMPKRNLDDMCRDGWNWQNQNPKGSHNSISMSLHTF